MPRPFKVGDFVEVVELDSKTMLQYQYLETEGWIGRQGTIVRVVRVLPDAYYEVDISNIGTAATNWPEKWLRLVSELDAIALEVLGDEYFA